MSYREMRNFTEMMRTLGYYRHISMENFRTPNFKLVAEILIWLLNRYEPNINIPTDIDTEEDRIIFIRSAVKFMSSKAHVKLNPSKLYQSDGYAVKELIKVASLLYNAITNTKLKETSRNSAKLNSLTHQLNEKLNDAKEFRQLTSEITNKGAVLYDLFSREVDNKELRSRVLANQIELNQVETWIRGSIARTQDELQKTKQLIENVASDEVNLDAKIEKKKNDLNRSQKRLETMKKLRPSFMDEYEKLEEELKRCYEIYVTKFCCLSYLEQQLEEYEWNEKEKLEEHENAMRSMLEKMKDTIPLDEVDAIDPLIGTLDTGDLSHGLSNRIAASSMMGSRETIAKRKKFGTMTAEDLDEESDSQLSDSDLELIDGDDGGSETGSEEVEIDAVVTRPRKNPTAGIKVSDKMENLDDF
ncbi:Clusterin-associated protein 1 [Chamberlinius hualienensis]